MPGFYVLCLNPLKPFPRGLASHQIPEFIKYTQPRYYRDSSNCYAQGWAFCTWMKRITKISVNR